MKWQVNTSHFFLLILENHCNMQSHRKSSREKEKKKVFCKKNKNQLFPASLMLLSPSILNNLSHNCNKFDSSIIPYIRKEQYVGLYIVFLVKSTFQQQVQHLFYINSERTKDMPTPPHHQNKLQLMPENDSGPSQLPEFRNSSGGLKQRARYSP